MNGEFIVRGVRKEGRGTLGDQEEGREVRMKGKEKEGSRRMRYKGEDEF